MATQKHTPGPWTNGTSGVGGKNLAVCSGPIVIAEVLGTGYPLGTGLGEHDEANARLIAAAPDMLEALQAIAKEIGPSYGMNDDPGSLNIASRIARAAIAKATQS